MKYRIKIVTCQSGIIKYYPQIKRWYGYENLTFCYSETKESALMVIENNYKCHQDKLIKEIKFEYIIK